MSERASASKAPSADRHLFESVPVGVYRMDPKGILLDANPALLDLLGARTVDEVVGRPLISFCVDEPARDRLERDLAAGEPPRHPEIRLRRVDGGAIWARHTARAERDASARPIWYEGVFDDLTERKQAEERLQRRLDFEQTLSRFSSRFAGTLDTDNAIVAGLGDLSALNGASRAYLFLVRPDGIHMDNTHEWCAEGVIPHRDELQGLPCADFPWWFERLGRGEAIHVRDVAAMPPEAANERAILEAQDIKSIIVFPVRVHGILAGFVGFDNVFRAEAWREDDLRLLEVASDILGNVLQRHQAQLALRMSETRFRLLVDQSPLSIQIFAADGTLLLANRSYERTWGVTREEVRDYNVLRDGQLEKEGVLPVLRRAFQGEAVITPPARYVPGRGAKTGREMWVRAVAYPVRDGSGAVREVVVIHEDMTEQRHAEAELDASRQQLALSEKLSALGALVSGVAHEIRTPLTYVLNHLALVEHVIERANTGAIQPADALPRLRDHATAAVEGVERINGLVNDLRGYAQQRMGPRESADLARVVGGAVDLFRATQRGRVEVQTRLESTQPLALEREKIQQVVLNLLTNAAEAMGSGGTIRLSTERVEGGAQLVVEDEGPGLSREALDRLFEPFFTTKSEGTGLGLSIVRRIVEEHHGSIRYEPNVPKGARFVVFLPAEPARA